MIVDVRLEKQKYKYIFNWVFFFFSFVCQIKYLFLFFLFLEFFSSFCPFVCSSSFFKLCCKRYAKWDRYITYFFFLLCFLFILVSYKFYPHFIYFISLLLTLNKGGYTICLRMLGFWSFFCCRKSFVLMVVAL